MPTSSLPSRIHERRKREIHRRLQVRTAMQLQSFKSYAHRKNKLSDINHLPIISQMNMWKKFPFHISMQSHMVVHVNKIGLFRSNFHRKGQRFIQILMCPMRLQTQRIDNKAIKPFQ